jgi:hypothetical protein
MGRAGAVESGAVASMGWLVEATIVSEGKWGV